MFAAKKLYPKALVWIGFTYVDTFCTRFSDIDVTVHLVSDMLLYIIVFYCSFCHMSCSCQPAMLGPSASPTLTPILRELC